jgi:hypothetical protein
MLISSLISSKIIIDVEGILTRSFLNTWEVILQHFIGGEKVKFYSLIDHEMCTRMMRKLIFWGFQFKSLKWRFVRDHQRKDFFNKLKI